MKSHNALQSCSDNIPCSVKCTVEFVVDMEQCH